VSVTVSLHEYFQDFTRGQTVVEAKGRTVAALIDDLEARYPGIKGHLVDKKGKLQGFVELFVNSQIVYPEDTGMSVQDGDEVEVLMIVAGG